MVRVNLIDPKKLADQHLVAEYNELLMLLGHVKKYPSLDGIPKNYCLGEGHIKFFKNKLGYLEKRHGLIRRQMGRRGFVVRKAFDASGFGREFRDSWKPVKRDFEIIKKRLVEKIRMKPEFYRYYGEKKGRGFFIGLIRKV
ncbi:MAG: pyrimidine dimer DNA glycosylase/endonuclease V [archaeon]